MKHMWYKQATPGEIEEYNGNKYEKLSLRKESARGAVVRSKIIFLRKGEDKKVKFLTFEDFGFMIFDKLWDFPDGSRIEIAMRKVED